jgi:peptide/nickel transport system substrate-binding protein
MNILGSGLFKLVSYGVGSAIKGVRNPDYYHKGLPYLDAFTGLYAPKQAVRVDAICSDRAAVDFRNLPPAARDELVGALGDKITMQASDLNCGNIFTPNQKKKPFDDVRKLPPGLRKPPIPPLLPSAPLRCSAPSPSVDQARARCY